MPRAISPPNLGATGTPMNPLANCNMVGLPIDSRIGMDRSEMMQVTTYRYKIDFHSGDSLPDELDTRVLPIVRGNDTKKYSQFLFKSSVAPTLIPKRFKILNIPKYDGIMDP
ncbi:hypothetical protein HAX54_020495 [Datura stramonium]|uniref:Uncharacterized protein n=1 Tax=Datura stramonium TaxID=4076 RepID=A0ABS8UT59_DATST|nr:hypothetical protein [Datura stramonium]